MQGHEIRHRTRREGVDGHDNSVTLEEELTPTSSDAHEETEGSNP
jgi:hypothetical protein